jgi:hypothetical protein
MGCENTSTGFEDDPFAEYAEEIVLTAEDDHDIPIGSADMVAKQGAKEALGKTKKCLTAMEQITLKVRENREQHLVVLQPEPFQDVIGKEEFWEELTECLSIVGRYREQGFETNQSTAEDDIMRLGGLLVNLSLYNSYMAGVAQQANSARRITRSRYFVAAKTAKQEMKLPLTDAEAEHISRQEVENYYANEHRLDVVARTVTGAYFAIQKFTDLLDRIANRQQRSERNAAS